MIEEDEISKKQNLLNMEIVDKNYDQNEFINFCLSKKENGDDLNSWTYDELENIVHEFVSENEKNFNQLNINNEKSNNNIISNNIIQSNNNNINNNNNDNNNNNNNNNNDNNNNNNNNNNKNNINNKQIEIGKEDVEKIDNFNPEDSKKFKDIVIKCHKLEKNQLNDKVIKIKIKNPQEIIGGVLSSNYIVYDLYTEPFNWKVTRRYSDFDKLRNILIKCFPGFNIPPLPNKKIGNRRFDTDFIEKRMKFLELFINNVCENESFKTNECLLAFLSYNDREKFEAKIKEYSSFNPSNYIEDYKTLDGKIIISHDERNEKYFININKYFSIQTQALDKLNDNLKLFFNNISEATENLKEVQKCFDILYLLNQKVLMKKIITKTFEELKDFFKNWRRILINQNFLIKDYIKDFFKYINLEGKSYITLINKREELKIKYTNDLNKLNTKKEKIYSTNDTNKFELNPNDKTIDIQRCLKDKSYAFQHICYKDNLNLKLIYNQLGYTNKKNIDELKKIIKNYTVRFVNNFKTLDEKFYPTINDLIGTWGNLETFIQSYIVQKKNLNIP